MLGSDQYKYDVDVQSFRNALKEVVTNLVPFTAKHGSAESTNYPGLAQFLTTCVKACHAALDKQNEFAPREERWYKDLEFTVAKTAADGVEGAAPVKPNVTGGIGISKLAEQRLYWKPTPDKPTYRITLPVEVKDDWKDMVAQAATYARCLFGASPMRTFALVLAFNHSSNALRFLVFHRGGLTASNECHTAKPKGLEGIARLFLTLALWRTAEEAGAVGCCNDETYLLPADKKARRTCLQR